MAVNIRILAPPIGRSGQHEAGRLDIDRRLCLGDRIAHSVAGDHDGPMKGSTPSLPLKYGHYAAAA
jgi:hypothetical protein